MKNRKPLWKHVALGLAAICLVLGACKTAEPDAEAGVAVVDGTRYRVTVNGKPATNFVVEPIRYESAEAAYEDHRADLEHSISMLEPGDPHRAELERELAELDEGWRVEQRGHAAAIDDLARAMEERLADPAITNVERQHRLVVQADIMRFAGVWAAESDQTDEARRQWIALRDDLERRGYSRFPRLVDGRLDGPLTDADRELLELMILGVQEKIADASLTDEERRAWAKLREDLKRKGVAFPPGMAFQQAGSGAQHTLGGGVAASGSDCGLGAAILPSLRYPSTAVSVGSVSATRAHFNIRGRHKTYSTDNNFVTVPQYPSNNIGASWYQNDWYGGSTLDGSSYRSGCIHTYTTGRSVSVLGDPGERICVDADSNHRIFRSRSGSLIDADNSMASPRCVNIPGGRGGGGGDDDDRPPPPGRDCTWMSGPDYGFWLCVIS